MPMPGAFTDDELLDVWDECHNLSEVVDKLYGNRGGGGYKTVKRVARKHELDVEAKKTHPSKSRRKSVKDLQSKNNLRRALLRERERKCENCERTKWQGREIPLEMHRVDETKSYGESGPDNLKLLCPNCHKFTDNWGRKKTAE
jgi:5-methylcytosine-specific restriction endonuclease McrA